MAFFPYLHYLVLGSVFYFTAPLYTSNTKTSFTDTEILRMFLCILIGARILGDELDYQHGIVHKRSGVTLKSKCSKRSRRSQGRPAPLILPPTPEGRVRIKEEDVPGEVEVEEMPLLEVPSDEND